MSLRGFHILFITLAFLCSAGFWAWASFQPEKARELNAVVLGNLSGSLALAVFAYGVWFVVKKYKAIRI